MSLVSPQQSSHTFSNSLLTSTDGEGKNTPDETEATLSTLLGAYTNGQKHTSMERGATEYTQSGLQTPYPHAFTDAQSEDSSADHASAAQYTPQQEVRTNNYSTSATPTSEYGVYPASARSGSFPEHLQRPYHPASNHSGSSGGMAQPTSPSIPLQDGRSNHQSAQLKSDQDVPIDPSIAASSPTYPAHGGQYSPYPPQEQMQHGYQQHPSGAMYTQPRPDWGGYGHPAAPHGMPTYPVSGAQTPTSAAPAGRPGQHHFPQVYSFVPIPGAQQHKRPRRRYEEIERMYKCGWNGCEKAYGTLNHLNAHVTMQSHGAKRTPEEFKEIRKEWKARKKEEEQQRKEADSARAAAAPADGQPPENAPPQGAYPPARSVQLPPIGYQPGAAVPNQYQAAPAAGGVQQLQEYGNNHAMQYSGYPASPYGAPNQMYNQPNGAQPKYEH
ncbi:Transcriptional regulator protein [Rutstroemia sp. NJR-2017a BVV2]|nr:Transcriptional regulator protein [Rutstroemia sp. NJR-2017a BVV2]